MANYTKDQEDKKKREEDAAWFLEQLTRLNEQLGLENNRGLPRQNFLRECMSKALKYHSYMTAEKVVAQSSTWNDNADD